MCERDTRFHTLLFQVLPDNVMKGKPALLLGSDSVRLRLVNVNADPQPSKLVQTPNYRNLAAPGKLRTDLLNQYHAVFQGLG